MNIDNRINSTPYGGLKVEKIWSSNTAETLLICMDQGIQFPDHTSPRETLLIVLEGAIEFSIEKNKVTLSKNESINFPANETHNVVAHSPSKFLIIR